MRAVGLIGVGFIGKVFLEELTDAGYPVTVYDVNDDQVEYATERGADAAESPAALACEVDTVVMALPGTPEVEAVMEASDGILDALDTGNHVIDVTTTHPDASVTYEAKCAERGITFVEAPITGAAPREGYYMMVGGTEENYSATSDLLDVLCDDHIRIGAAGDATIFKLGLQMRYAGHNALDAEVVEFVRDNGVDPKPLNDFLGMDIWDQYFTGDYSPAIEGLGGLAIWHKDIGYARDVARENETALPMNAVVHEAYKAGVRRADEDEGHAAAVIEYWKALNDANARD